MSLKTGKCEENIAILSALPTGDHCPRLNVTMVIKVFRFKYGGLQCITGVLF